MTCRQCQHLLSPYLDNVLPPDERSSVLAHLAQCAACAERLRQYEGNRQLLCALPTAEVSRAMELLLQSQIQRLGAKGLGLGVSPTASQTPNPKSHASSLTPHAWWRRWGMISAGALAVASFLFYLSTMHTPPPVSAEEVVASMDGLIKALDENDEVRMMYEETEEEALPDWREELDRWPAGDGRDLRRW